MNLWFERMIPHTIFCVTTCLVLFGLVMVYSSSAFYDYRQSSRPNWEKAVEEAVSQATVKAGETGTGTEAIKRLDELRRQDTVRRTSMLSTFLRQTRWVFLGFLFLTLAARVDYPLWGKRIGWLLTFFFSCQALLFILPANTDLPLQSRVINGARSWIMLFSFRFQPSEAAKLGLIIFVAWFLARRLQSGKESLLSLVPGLLVCALSVTMILCETDLGVATHLCIALMGLWVLAGVKFRHIMLMGVTASAVLGALVLKSPEYISRFFDTFQVKQAKAAFSRGGLFGIGLGDGDADLAWLYGAHTDFILAVVGEELGFIVTSALVLGYLFLILLGIKVAAGCVDPFGALLALGITILIGTQAFLNMVVVTGLGPTTGFTLPLLSYGGSSLIWTMAGIGIVINISLTTPSQLLGDGKRGAGAFTAGGLA